MYGAIDITMNKLKNPSPLSLNSPLLSEVRIDRSTPVDASQYPFSLNIIKNLKEIRFPTQVTFFIGENGTGKSTLLEAIAHHAGFGSEGGARIFPSKHLQILFIQACKILLII